MTQRTNLGLYITTYCDCEEQKYLARLACHHLHLYIGNVHRMYNVLVYTSRFESCINEGYKVSMLGHETFCGSSTFGNFHNK